MRIEAATREDVERVAQAMRQSDVDEFLAVSWAADRHALADSLVERFGQHPDALCFSLDERPVGIGALIEWRPNVVTILFFATDEFPRIAMAVARFMRARMLPEYRAAGIHRIECIVSAAYTAAQRWIEIVGLTREAEMPGYGRGGETFLQYAWTADHVRSTGTRH
ncbi:hypothetical protein NPA31_011920 [Aurantimonas sp. MSK8Z-1]|uniref:hypothetical protein n=1 Tax=Mangrovibrevibacter kandeliae TaxID=2968473 RepID=UPI0021179811|nr:hypothetical protein [Aurantimonas sp. MSK8Z-1]MCW4115671.1 hypothetical protein [Aurantimonas sp. MSK8Z-1]